MTTRNIIPSHLFSLLLILMLLAQLLPGNTATAQSNASEHLAVILILDDSGSMKTSDPSNLRYMAAQLFVSLLDDGDAAGALRFSTTSSQITNGIEIIASPEGHTRLVELLTAVHPDGFTDVKAAFEEAQRMKAAFNQAGFKVAVIFLTDGKPEIPNPYDTYEQEALEAAHGLNVPILSVALTHAGQSSFLNRLASETGGRVIFAESAADLLDIYLQILGDLKDRTVIGTGDSVAPGNAVLPLDPALTPYIDQVSYIVSKPAGVTARLIAPDGQTISAESPGVAFAIQDPRFVVYTLPQPAGGDWRFELTGRGSVQARAILYSRLRVRLVSPQGSFEAGQPLPLVVRLVEEQPGQPPVTIIGEANFAAWITRPDGAQDSLDGFFDDGTHGDTLAGDGLFARTYVNTALPGTYRLAIRGSKGTVPVASQALIQGIAFPSAVLDQPAQSRYDIRDNSVPLQLHLAGADVNELDHGGFKATVTEPDGAHVQIQLNYASQVFTGEYFPTQDGIYQVRFEPVDATYQILPYLHHLETTFEARLIPTLAIQEIQIGLQTVSEKGNPRFELAQAQQGIPLMVAFSSSSPRQEKVSFRLEDMPGFILTESTDLMIAANGRTTLILHLISDPTLEAQVVQGRLVATTPEGVDLVNGEVPLTFELFEPALAITPSITSTVSPDTCLQWAPVRLVLHLISTSSQSERIQLHLEDLPGVSLSQEMITVLPGESQVEINLLSQRESSGSQRFQPGSYAGKLVIEGLRPGLKLAGNASIPISFQVDPLWITCRRSMIISGAALLFGVMLTTVVVARIHRQSKPPIVSGTLIHWDTATPDLTTDINLTAISKTQVRIGKGSQNEVVIPDESMEDEHLVITAERGEAEELRFMLHPKANIRKGYREYTPASTAGLPLEENVQYQMGNRVFKYIRDINL